METSQVRIVQANLANEIAGNYFNAGDIVRLYLSTFTPTPNSTLTDFEANKVASTDIADVATVAPWIAGVDLVNRALLIQGGLLVFQPAGTAVFPILTGGWYVTDSSVTKLLAHGSFDTPFSFDNLLDSLLLKPSLFWDALSEVDAEFIDGP